MKEVAFNGLSFRDAGGGYAFIRQGGQVRAVLKGGRQGRKAKEVLRVLEKNNIDGARLDGRFFSVLSVYLSEEKYLDCRLLQKEIGRFL